MILIKSSEFKLIQETNIIDEKSNKPSLQVEDCKIKIDEYIKDDSNCLITDEDFHVSESKNN